MADHKLGELLVVIGGFHAWKLRLDDGEAGPTDVWRSGERLVLLPMRALAGFTSLARLIGIVPIAIRSSRLLVSPAAPPTGGIAQFTFRLVVSLLIWGYCTWRLSKLEPAATETRVELAVEAMVRYIMGFVGLGIFIVGLAGVLSVNLQVMIREPIGAGLRDKLAPSTSVLAFGLLL